MMKQYTVLFFMLFLTASCHKNGEGYIRAKTDKLEQRLIRGNGIWNIDEIKREKYNGASLETVLTENSAGTWQFFFNSDGTTAGASNYVWDGNTYQGDFGWSVLGAQARINLFICCDAGGNLLDVYYTIAENEKTRQVWYTFSEDGAGVKYKTTYTLSFCSKCEPDDPGGTNVNI